jgi:hypothetical protein
MNTQRAQRAGRRRAAGVRLVLGIGAALALVAASGCRSPAALEMAPLTLRVEPDAYARVFLAARDTLLEAGYTLERVDAHAGVLTTRPSAHAPAGADDLLSRQLRSVRVMFDPAPGSPADGVAVAEDGTVTRGPTTMRVRVLVHRVQAPGWRPAPIGMGLASRTFDPALYQRGLLPATVSVVREDLGASDDLAARIGARAGLVP